MSQKIIAPLIQDTITKIQETLNNPADLRLLMTDEAGCSVLVFFEGLVDEKNLFSRLEEFLACNGSSNRLKLFREVKDLRSSLPDLFNGHALFIQLIQDKVTIFNLPSAGWQLRPIQEPFSEQLIRGPREGFTETISANTAMIRRWIHDENLKVEEYTVGVRTKTAVRLLYLKDVVNPDLVKEVSQRISAIKIDGVIESGYLEQLITDNRLTVFPLIQSTERSDKVTAAILEGRVAIMVDKSPFALIIPTTVNEMYQSPEDYYFNFYLGSFLRFFRLLGNNLAVVLSGLYVALAYHNPELLPIQLILSISQSRMGIPYPLYIEVFLLEVFVEIFREAGIRLPSNVNQILVIVAGISLAFAAVVTRLVSGASLVVVALGAIALFSAPSYAIGIPWRIFKFILILGGAGMGIVGLSLTGILIIAHAATLTSFGTSYLEPWAPIRPYALQDSFFRIPLWLRAWRLKTYDPNDLRRAKDTDEPQE